MRSNAAHAARSPQSQARPAESKGIVGLVGEGGYRQLCGELGSQQRFVGRVRKSVVCERSTSTEVRTYWHFCCGQALLGQFVGEKAPRL